MGDGGITRVEREERGLYQLEKLRGRDRYSRTLPKQLMINEVQRTDKTSWPLLRISFLRQANSSDDPLCLGINPP